MQVISSLLNLQAREITDPGTLGILRESQSRVKSMALVHEKMYQSNNLAAIEFGDYIRSLVPNLIHQFGKKNVSCSIEADPIHLEVDTAIPCGLIVNELVTNALKHGFPNGKDGMIGIAFRTIDDHKVQLIARDNGVGFPSAIDFRNTTSLGMKLVNSLVKQIGGTIDMTTGTGTTFTITFPRTEK
jgi:two-component sensor histidine kinase